MGDKEKEKAARKAVQAIEQPSEQRLNKVIAQSGYCSRRKADEMIKEGRVTINGKTALLGEVVGKSSKIKIDGAPLKLAEKKVLYAYYKPRGYSCTNALNIADSIFHQVKIKERVFSIGRLDKISEGLLLLTNDGRLNNRLLKHKESVNKVYEVSLEPPLNKKEISILENGVDIGEEHTTRPCDIKMINSRRYLFTLREGKNRQIRRMLESVDKNVLRLKRIQFAHLKLSQLKLKPGEWKKLRLENFIEELK